MTDKTRGSFEKRTRKKESPDAIGLKFIVVRAEDRNRNRLWPGIWQKTIRLVPGARGNPVKNSKVKPILIFVNSQVYKRMFNLPEVVEKVVKRDLSFEFNKAMEQALRTAK